MYKMLSLTHCKKILQSFLRLLPQLFLFELAFKVCIRRNFSEIHFLDRKGKEIRYILSSGFDSSKYA